MSLDDEPMTFNVWMHFAYSWKHPAYNGAFLLTVVLCLGASLLTIGAFLLTIKLFCLQWESANNKHLDGL